MAKISLANRIRKVQRIRIITILAGLALLFMIGELIISNNPKESKATNPNPTYCDGSTDANGVYNCTISTNLTLNPGSTLDNTNLTIMGNITITSNGHHDFNNVTVSAATVTTTAMTDTSNTATSGTMQMEPTKLVDWSVKGTLLLESAGQINVDSKGYLGGTHTSSNDAFSGPGAGSFMNEASGAYTSCFGGGGAFGGRGRTGKTNPDSTNTAAGGVYQGVSLTTFDRGSGGGHSRCLSTPYNVNGGAGGGAIHIKANKIIQESGTNISANGQAVTNNTTAYGGAGSGGAIWIEAESFSSDYAGGGPNVMGGNSILAASEMEGITNSSDPKFSGIRAKGGDSDDGNAAYGGGGGGGVIRLEVKKTNELCTVTSGTTASPGTIPYNCENADVIIEGSSVVVDAGAVSVWQQPGPGESLPSGAIVGDACWDSSSKYCDTRRHFASLTVNGATITHLPLRQDQLSGATNQDTDGDYSVADEITGDARWQKVDFIIQENLTLNSGGRIDVSGKGYPGSWYSACNGNSYKGLYSREGYFDIGDGSGAYPPKGSYHGFGPSGGLSLNETDGGRSGGGGFGGNGGAPNHYGTDIGLSRSYSVDGNDDKLEWGSGGGAAGYDGSGDDTACGTGGDGGGKIVITANKIIFNSIYSYIKANGLSNQETTTVTGRPLASDANMVGEGGGSGGLVYLKVQKLEYNGTGYASALAANGFSGGQSGQIVANNFMAMNIYASGGDARYQDIGGGGGGWIVIKRRDYFPDATVMKTLVPIDRPDGTGTPNQNFNPYSLRVGDTIKIDLVVSGITTGASYTLTDDWLSTGSKYCVPNNDGTMTETPISGADASPLVWNTTNTTISYTCTVQP